MTLDYGNYGIFLIMGNAGFISSTVGARFGSLRVCSRALWVSGLRVPSLDCAK